MKALRFVSLASGLLLLNSLAQAQTAPQLARDYVHGPGGRLAVTLEPDNYPPEPPAFCSATPAGPCPAHGIDVDWGVATDIGSGTAYYKLYRNGLWLGDFTTGPYRDFDIQDSQTYTYSVRAVDNVGHIGEPTSSNSVYFDPCIARFFFPGPQRPNRLAVFAHVSLWSSPIREPHFSERVLHRVSLGLFGPRRTAIAAGGGGQ